MPYTFNPFTGDLDFYSSANGDVVGPAVSTDMAIARFDGTTGKLLQNSGVIINDTNVMTGVTQLNVDNIRLDGNTISSTDANGDINLTPNGTGQVVSDARGYDVNPGSDIDADLITVNVTGSPKLSWDESSDGFRLSGGSGLVIGAEGDLSHTINGAAFNSEVEIHSSDTQDLGGLTLHRHTDNALYGGHVLNLRSNGTFAAPSIVNDGDTVSRYVAAAYDGTDFALMAEIRAEVDGTPGADDMPGRLVFYTSPDGSQTPTEAMRLSQDQTMTLANPLSVGSGGTGVATLADGGILLGSGVGAVTATAQPTDGQLLVGSSGNDPVLATLTAGAGISVTNGAGSITVTAAGEAALAFPTDSGTATPSGNDLNILGGAGVDVSGAGNTVTVAGEDASDTNKGIATFDATDFTVTAGDVVLNTVGVAKGGTGATSLTDGGILLGSGTGTVTVTSQPTNGQILIGSTGVDPVLGTLTAPAAGLDITGGAGSITFALADDLAAVEGLASTGIAARTAADTWAVRTVTGTANQISVSNGDGVSGDPTLSLPSNIHVDGVSFDSGTNVLSVYEEGTFNPFPDPTTGAYTSLTYNSRSGSYTRIGNRVFFTLSMDVSATIGTASGVVFLKGLPYTPSPGNDVGPAIIFNVDLGTNGEYIQADILAGGVVLRQCKDNAAYTSVSVANLGTLFILQVSGAYEV